MFSLNNTVNVCRLYLFDMPHVFCCCCINSSFAQELNAYRKEYSIGRRLVQYVISCSSFKPIIWNWLNVDGYPKQARYSLTNILPPSLFSYSSFSSAFGLSVSQVVLWLLMLNRFSFYSFLKFLNRGGTIQRQSFLPSLFIYLHLVFGGKRMLAWDCTIYSLQVLVICLLSRTCNLFLCISSFVS